MGISRITAYTIASNPDVRVSAGGPDKDGKFTGWITLGEADLLNTEAVYDTPEAAKEEMSKIIISIKELVEKELDGKDPISHIMGRVGADDQTIERTKEIITASKGG